LDELERQLSDAPHDGGGGGSARCWVPAYIECPLLPKTGSARRTCERQICLNVDRLTG